MEPVTYCLSYEGFYFAPVSEYLRVLADSGELTHVTKVSDFQLEASDETGRRYRFCLPSLRYKLSERDLDLLPRTDRPRIAEELEALGSADAVAFIWDAETPESDAGSARCFRVLLDDLALRGSVPILIVFHRGDNETLPSLNATLADYGTEQLTVRTTSADPTSEGGLRVLQELLSMLNEHALD